MPEGFHPPLEEYLETIQSLNEGGIPVIQARIAERLNRSAPSVSEMLDRLAAEGYLERSGRSISLTERGRDVANSVLRKHRLAERLLVDVIGLPWHRAHLEAGRWEHVISEEVEERLVILLGNPTTCPHGNPIPGSGDSAGSTGQVRMAELNEGQDATVRRITEEIELRMPLLRFLDESGLVPGRTFRVTGKLPDGSLRVEVSGELVVVEPEVSMQVYVSAAA